MARSTSLQVVATLAILPFLFAVAAPATADWNQLRGEADRSTTIVPPRGVLDVVSSVSSLDPFAGEWKILGHAGPYAVTKGDQLGLVLTRNVDTSPTCKMATGTLDGDVAIMSETAVCNEGWLQAYWEPGGLTIVCSAGPETSKVMQAFKADGREAWSIEPARDLDIEDLGLAGGAVTWTCDGSALLPSPANLVGGDGADDLLAVPFLATTGQDGVRHRIALIELQTGAVRWVTTVSTTAAVADGGASTEFSSPSFLPTALAASFNGKGEPVGLLVSGLVVCPQQPSTSTLPSGVPPLPALDISPCRAPQGQSADLRTSYAGAVAWLSMEGTTHGFDFPTPDEESDQGDLKEAVSFHPMVSRTAAAQGARFAVQVGGRILIVDPTRAQLDETIVVPVVETESPVGFWPAPVWQPARLAVPTDREIWFVHPVSLTLDPVPWPTPLNTERIVDLAGDSLGRLFVLTAEVRVSDYLAADTAGYNATVYILDQDGDESHRLPLQSTQKLVADGALADARWLQAPQFVQVGSTLAVVDANGGMFTLGSRAGESPSFSANLTNAYPPVDADVALIIRPADPSTVARAVFRWDRGYVEDVAWPDGATFVSRDHFYSQAGFKDVLVTLVSRDGTTATISKTINVGGTPPPPPPVLNPLQQAFSNENANTTWGLIGIGLALLGGIIGVLQSRRARSHLRKTLHELQKIREHGKTDAMAAIEQLQELRADVHDRAVAGSYDQAHLHMIESKAALTARLLMQQAIEPFRDRLTPIYQGMLAGFFEDGRLGAHEIEVGLRGLASQSRLRPGEKDTVRRIFVLLDGSA